jgi:hypothetical protein
MTDRGLPSAKTAMILAIAACLAGGAWLIRHFVADSNRVLGTSETATAFQRQALALPMTFGAHTHHQGAYLVRRAATGQHSNDGISED